MKKTIICISSILIYILAAGINLAQAQEQSKGARVNSRDETSNSQFQLTDLLAQARPQRGISLMPVSSNPAASGAAFVITPAAVANLPVVGNGTSGRLTKWMGFTSNNSAIGDSSIYEDKLGKVGIGTDSPTSKLTVAGLIESSGAGGGVKFPDGTVQTTSASSALLTVVHDQTLMGSGTLASPLIVVQSEVLIEPVAAEITIDFPAGQFGVQDALYTVPAGKRLIIELVSADCRMPIGQRLQGLGIQTRPSTGALGIIHLLIPVFVGTNFGSDISIVSQAIKVYAAPSTAVGAHLARSASTDSADCRVRFSGFLVNLP